MSKRFLASKFGISIATAFSIFLLVSPVAKAAIGIFYDFNATGSLASNFDDYVSQNSGTIEQSANGGIGDSGAIHAPWAADAVYTTKSTYSIGPIGSTYTFSAFMKSVGNSGYSGVGFTASTANSDAETRYPFRPADALGVSVHGGGFVLHNGATDASGNWDADNSSAGITTVTRANIFDLLNSGSSDNWYKIVFKLTRDSQTTFDARVEVWPSDANGNLLRPNAADAIFEWLDISNPDLISAPAIHSYINFSGYRVEYFDNYQVQLGGGSTVIAAGAPVVLTNNASQTSGVVNFEGNVTSAGGNTVTERGFAYGTSSAPTISDSKVAVGSGTGVFTGSTTALPNGTYYFRSYAVNATGVSYGSEVEIVITDSSAAQASASPTSSPSASASAISAAPTNTSTNEALAHTGYDSPYQIPLALIMMVLGYNAYLNGFRAKRKAAIIKWLGLEWLDFKLK